ncbi:RNA polymerase sigma factor SigF [Gloeobacter kilaueensis JS1]|uniref:RNA polymerase sigma factor SigF n=2 Tax=Gloeobacter TaxID=33071 RepID=U5QN83_GLOK1|nr:RNA polymerase sigma factor SigF [Gloeobacter kilaueensis JS1]
MDRCLKAESTPSDWVGHWHRLWREQGDSTARAHLCAFLQAAAYWSVLRFVSSTWGRHSLAECFQIVMAEVDKVLEGFEPEHGDLDRYARVVFSNALNRHLRQQRVMEICTDWALLRRLSQKLVAQALRGHGESAGTIERYLAALRCYTLLYVPKQASGSRHLEKPSPKILEAIVRLYNEQVSPDLALNTPDSASRIESWLIRCARIVRSYLYPAHTSLNVPLVGSETGEWLDLFVADEGESLLDQLDAAESQQVRQSLQSQLQQALVAALDQLKPEARQMLAIYYCGNSTQQQMASQFNIGQYTVSRRLQHARRALLLSLCQWSARHCNEPLGPEALDQMGEAIEEWLVAYYRQL